MIRGAFADFSDPISPEELAGLAMEPELDSRIVARQADKWQVAHGPFESFDAWGDTDWSLLVQAVDHWFEPVNALVAPFRVLPNWRLDDLMISYSLRITSYNVCYTKLLRNFPNLRKPPSSLWMRSRLTT